MVPIYLQNSNLQHLQLRTLLETKKRKRETADLWPKKRLPEIRLPLPEVWRERKQLSTSRKSRQAKALTI